MWTASKIRRFVFQLPKGQMFASMELVHMGPRYMIDSTTSNMVKAGIILRLANGVFVRNDHGLKLPSREEVAAYKAKIFAKRIFVHGSEAAAKLRLKKSDSTKTIFAINGSSSSYVCLGKRIYFHGLSPRKVALADSPIGLVIRALWHLKKGIAHEDVVKATRVLNHRQKEELRAQARFMPGWLIAHFPWGNPDSIAA